MRWHIELLECGQMRSSLTIILGQLQSSFAQFHFTSTFLKFNISSLAPFLWNYKVPIIFILHIKVKTRGFLLFQKRWMPIKKPLITKINREKTLYTIIFQLTIYLNEENLWKREQCGWEISSKKIRSIGNCCG